MLIPQIPDKPFLPYEQQIQKLREHNIIVNNESLAIEVLRSVSYYSIVNGYKYAFSHSGDYPEGTTFETLYTVHLISVDLSNLLLKNILLVEKSFKTKMAYLVAENFGVCTDIDDLLCSNPNDYLFKNYYSNPRNSRNNILKSIKENACRHPSSSFIHYRDNKNHIPPWIIVDNIPFGVVINWYSILKSRQKDDIVNQFFSQSNLSTEGKKEIFKCSLNILKEYRNVFAHGNRIIGVNCDTVLSPGQILSLSFNCIDQNLIRQGVATNDLTSLLLILTNLLEIYAARNIVADLNNLLGRYIVNNIDFAGKNIFEIYSFPDNLFDILRSIINNRLN